MKYFFLVFFFLIFVLSDMYLSGNCIINFFWFWLYYLSSESTTIYSDSSISRSSIRSRL